MTEARLKPLDLNPERLEYYKRVLNCQPTMNLNAARRKLVSLRSVAEHLDELRDKFNNEVGELADMEIGLAPAGIGLHYWRVNERPQACLTPHAEVGRKNSREQWTERPSSSQALEA